jgi:hypothetical protein
MLTLSSINPAPNITQYGRSKTFIIKEVHNWTNLNICKMFKWNALTRVIMIALRPSMSSRQHIHCKHWPIYILYTPWPESTSELYRLSDRRLSSKLVPTFAYRVVSRGQHNGSPRPYSRLSRPDTDTRWKWSQYECAYLMMALRPKHVLDA